VGRPGPRLNGLSSPLAVGGPDLGWWGGPTNTGATQASPLPFSRSLTPPMENGPYLRGPSRMGSPFPWCFFCGRGPGSSFYGQTPSRRNANGRWSPVPGPLDSLRPEFSGWQILFALPAVFSSPGRHTNQFPRTSAVLCSVEPGPLFIL